MYMYAFIGTGSGVVFVLGFFIKNTPKWSAWGTVVFNTILSLVVFSLVLGTKAQQVIPPLLEGVPWLHSLYLYFVKVPFVVTTVIIIPCSVGFYLLSLRFYRRGADPKMDASVDQFFKDKETPVDFDKEVGHDNTAAQAGLIGWLSFVYGIFVLLIVLIPNDWIARCAILFCALVLMGIGGALLLYRRKVLGRSAATVERRIDSHETLNAKKEVPHEETAFYVD